MYDQKWLKMIIDKIVLIQYQVSKLKLNRDLTLQLKMAHFPYLQKEQVHKTLKQQSSQKYHRVDWKANINNQILQKYAQIRRKQQENKAKYQQKKEEKQLPYYFIFPTQYSKNSKITSFMDNIRLQRIKNGHNKKYQQKVWPDQHSNIKRQTQSQLFLKRYDSQSDLRVSASTIRKKIAVDNQPKTKISGKQNPNQQYIHKQYQNKSTKSLSQTNISPSRISKFSKKIIQPQHSSKYQQQALPTQSQISFDNVNIEYLLPTQSNQNSNKKNMHQQTPNSKYDKFGQRPKTQRNQSKNKLTYNHKEFTSNKSNFQNQSQSESKFKKKQENEVSNKQSMKQLNDKETDNRLKIRNQIKSGKAAQEYYDEQKMQDYESIKAQRDYLRIKFIQHLQYRHQKQLPYKVKAQYYQSSMSKKQHKTKSKK